MDRADQWSHRFSASSTHSSSRRYQSSRSELYFGGDDADVEDDCKQEFLCPFCAEEFDVVGLYCHIEEEHAVEVKNGVCPVCAKRVGLDMVYHITMQHGNILKVQRKRRSRRGTSSSIFSLLRKELRDVNLQALSEGSSYLQFSSNPDPVPDPKPDADPLISSFIYSSSIAEDCGKVIPSSEEAISTVETKTENDAESSVPPKLTQKDEEEKAQRSVFVQQLLFSTILEDNL